MVSENTVWKVRPYGEAVGDYQMVNEWHESRGLGKLMENVLPPIGVIVEMDGEPVAASWLYLCYGIGVAFWEGLVARPSLSLQQSRETCRHCIGAFKAIAAANHTSIIKAYAPEPLASEALKNGFFKSETGLVSLITSA